MVNKEIKQSLNILVNWAEGKISAGNEPPWAWFQYMKLIEVCETILKQLGATSLHIVKEDEAVKIDDINLPM